MSTVTIRLVISEDDDAMIHQLQRDYTTPFGEPSLNAIIRVLLTRGISSLTRRPLRDPHSTLSVSRSFIIPRSLATLIQGRADELGCTRSLMLRSALRNGAESLRP